MTKSALTCPRCAVALVAAPDVVDAAASTCPKCRGIFLEDVRAYRDVESVTRPALFEWRRIPSATEQQQPLSCPKCAGSAPMLKGASERDRRVVVDVGPRCGGAWLDGGELDAIQVDALPRFLATLARWLHEA